MYGETMNYQLLTIAGVFGMIISLIHGYLGFRLVLSQIENIPKTTKLINEFVFQLSTLYWFCGGLMLVMLPLFPDDESRKVAALVVAFLYSTGALANFIATKGRHFGWMVLAVITVTIVVAL